MAYTNIDKSSLHFNTKVYTGNESAGHAITGVGFQPDFTWFKNRGGTDSHSMYDAVRGVTKQIESDTTGAETTESTGLTSFDSDGFTVGTRTASNSNNMSICSWNWKASNATAVSNTDGSITSSVSANTTAGFSIVKYGNTTGTQTVGHGLGSDVKVLIIKNLTSATNWHVWHTGIPTSAIHLNETSGKTDSWFANYQNSTAPTSSVFTVKSGNGDDVLGSSQDYVAYCFAEKTGFSKFGSYVGNGNADGAFVYTGFKPSFIIMKEYTNSGQGWCMKTNSLNERVGNPNDYFLKADTNDVENTSTSFQIDMVSNGFKLRNTDGIMNGSGRGFIYMAFAAAPLVGNNNVPCTAR